MSIQAERPPATPTGLKRPLTMGFQGADLKNEVATQAQAPVLNTLSTYFGHNQFRSGQQEVVEAVVQGKHTLVFWATGAGKSICYQLPALHLNRTVVVVSPLISLMVDQVHKFNATAGAVADGPRATYLGSAQLDSTVEADVVRGLYRLVYVTPEKLNTSFMDRMKTMHDNGQLALLAVDEAHCISEWGHDFRPAYRQIKNVRDVIPKLPVMALTATAVPRVQDDILLQLQLQNENPVVSKSSFDRPNLALTCTRKVGKHQDFARIAKIAAEGGSTIVYVPTQNETENVASFLKDRLQSTGIQVGSYHGGQYAPDREAAHMDFLSGRMQVIVATVAFGMGIDKPDIRRIVHYGPPKTVEEYFQQVGRAGRDGLKASCELISGDNDFANYSSEFYTKGLTPEAREQQLKSTEALRKFAGSCLCRRRWLLEYFGEESPFGDRCGTCDTCVTSKAHAGDTTRDFRAPAACIFEAVAAFEDFPQSMTYVMALVGGSWKPKGFDRSAQNRNDAMERIKTMKVGLTPVMRREAFMKELLLALCSEGYLERRKIQATVGAQQFAREYDVYVRSEKGKAATGGSIEVRLPVPQMVRQQEEEEKRKIEMKKQELVKGGVDLKQIPVQELEHGEGKTIDAQLAWTRRLNHFREKGQEEKAKKLEELVSRIRKWRDEAAQKLRMAPAAVLGDLLVINIAYAQPTSVEALRGIGVRIAGLEELATLMQTSVQELFPKAEAGDEASQANGTQSENAAGGAMRLPDAPWKAPLKWEKAIYKQGKNGKLPVWEEYYNRWAKGEHPQAIAVNPPSGKAVQVNTVWVHCMTALTHGRLCALRKLAEQCNTTPPDSAQWQRIEEAAAIRGQNVDADDYKSKEVLCGILGAEHVNEEGSTKSDDQKAKEATWYAYIRWWEALKRVRFPVEFEAPGGDQKRMKA